ncbi:UNC93-like protein like [Argiope bruennichi]|uniref:UNC93-like protein like n=1 Tax=Argiope bruennichi TaxID=94029 RepID=A0A8T0FUL5_ARGBR|nr:UNC93-like protein like [Argiope bruennichi]
MDMQQTSAEVKSSPRYTKFRVIKNLVIISSTFLMLFTAYDGLSMLQSTMNKEHNIGTISQAVVYAGFCISSMLLPKYVIKKLGCRITILIGSISFIPYIAANFYPNFFTMMPSAFLLGVGSSLIWGAQCTYFNESALIYCTLTAREEIKKSNTESAQTSTEAISSIAESNVPSVEDLSVRNSNSKIINDISANNSNYQSAEQLSYKNLNSNYNHFYENSQELISTPEVKAKFKGDTFPEKTDITQKRGSYSINKMNAESNDIGKNLEERSGNEPQNELNSLPTTTGKRVSIIAPNFNSNQREGNATSSRQNRESYYRVPRKSTGYIDALQRFAGLESITARFFGCHGLVFHSAQVWSNLVSYYILQVGNHVNATVNSTCFCGSQFCNSQPDCVGVSASGIDEDLRYLLSGLSVILAVIGVMLVIIFLDPLNTEKEPVKFNFNVLMATFRNCKKIEQLFLIPISLYVGMIQGFYTADFTKSFIGCAWGSSYVGIVTVFYGLACALAATLSGYLVKYIGRIPIFLTAQLVNLGISIFMMLWIPDSDHPAMFFVTAGLCGFVTGVFWAQIPAFYGVLFKKDEEAAFGCYYVCSSMGWLIPFTISDYICTSVKIYILLTVSTLGILGYMVTERIYSKTKNQISLRFG